MSSMGNPCLTTREQEIINLASARAAIMPTAQSSSLLAQRWLPMELPGFKLRHCDECGDEIGPSDNGTELDDDTTVCADCMRDVFLECPDCQEIVRQNDSLYDRCESCGEHYFTCEDCDETCHEDDANAVHGRNPRTGSSTDRTVCDNCASSNYTRCSDCSEYWPDGGMTEIRNGGNVCQSCFEENYFMCDNCDHAYHTDSYGSEGCCDNCESSDSPIIKYDADYDLAFFGETKKGDYLGWELEVVAKDNRDETAQECLDAIGTDFAVCKEDGSLPCGGFEIVSAPATLDVHWERAARLLDDIPSGLGSWAHSSCGMHVHASRAPISQLTIGKILVFINADENQDLVTDIAGRSQSTYANISPKKIIDVLHGQHGRYQAINLQNDDTIEFRIFKGTLKKRSFFKNLEFTAATIQFCRHAGLTELTDFSFLAWVGKRQRDYPNLVAWLRDHSWLAKPKPRKIPTTTTTTTTTESE